MIEQRIADYCRRQWAQWKYAARYWGPWVTGLMIVCWLLTLALLFKKIFYE